ncbi:hypothetical protein JTE90_001838 [Oedothorax gibbosus]|uniref:Uncharacterized protein n=1 Tax=Oedothorax gibbosus TaxID=931172 RepID=A0AAV6U6D3_9ARAC|nr:hypothetical protein JTE90_001838 [Oedothorax gibbosus]
MSTWNETIIIISNRYRKPPPEPGRIHPAQSRDHLPTPLRPPLRPLTKEQAIIEKRSRLKRSRKNKNILKNILNVSLDGNEEEKGPHRTTIFPALECQ